MRQRDFHKFIKYSFPGETFRAVKEKEEKQDGECRPAAWFWKYDSNKKNRLTVTQRYFVIRAGRASAQRLLRPKRLSISG